MFVLRVPIVHSPSSLSLPCTHSSPLSLPPSPAHTEYDTAAEEAVKCRGGVVRGGGYAGGGEGEGGGMEGAQGTPAG